MAVNIDEGSSPRQSRRPRVVQSATCFYILSESWERCWVSGRCFRQKLVNARCHVCCYLEICLAPQLLDYISKVTTGFKSGHFVPARGGLVDRNARRLGRRHGALDGFTGLFARDHEREQPAVFFEGQVDELASGETALMSHNHAIALRNDRMNHREEPGIGWPEFAFHLLDRRCLLGILPENRAVDVIPESDFEHGYQICRDA